jgi:outer membrane protein, heavy metal efflux system
VQVAGRAEPLSACLERRLDLAALRAGYAAQEARLRQAHLEQVPDVSVGLSSARNESALRFAGGFVSFALPFFQRNQAAVADAESTRARLRREFEARVLAIRGEIHTLSAGIAILDRQIAEVRDELGAAALLERAERVGLQREEVQPADYAAVRDRWMELELELTALAQARDEAQVSRETACGGTKVSQWGTRFSPAAAEAGGASASDDMREPTGVLQGERSTP